MTRILLTAWAAMLLSAFMAGCASATVTVPDYSGGGWGQPEPSATITRANTNDKADLVRENTELRDRLSWVENRNRSLSKKYNEQGNEMAEARQKRDQYAAERDRYRTAGGDHE